jgi:hypothetical protein
MCRRHVVSNLGKVNNGVGSRELIVDLPIVLRLQTAQMPRHYFTAGTLTTVFCVGQVLLDASLPSKPIGQ